MWLIRKPFEFLFWLFRCLKKSLVLFEDLIVVVFHGLLEGVRGFERRLIVRERSVASWLAPYFAWLSRLIPWSYLLWIERQVAAAYFGLLHYAQVVVERLIPKPVRDVAYLVLFPFFYVVGSGFGFLWAWLQTRSIWGLVGGLPACCLALPFAYVISQLPVRSEAQLAERYREDAKQAFKDQHYDAALLWHRKLLQLGFVDQYVEYDAILAQLERKEIGMEEALRGMQAMAPADHLGFVPAHLWIASAVAAGELETRRELAETHLALIRAVYAQHPHVKRIEALLKGRFDDPRVAIRDLQQVAQAEPGAYLESALMAAREGMAAEAQALAAKAEEHYQARHAAGRAMEIDEFLRWITASEMAHGFRAAEETLLTTLRHKPHDDRALKFAAQFYSHWLNEMAWKLDQHPDDLALALRCLPLLDLEDRGRLIGKFADLVVEGDAQQSEQARRVMTNLARMANQAELSTQLHRQLGDAFLSKGSWELALAHYRVVLEREPHDHGALNNVAWLMTQQQLTGPSPTAPPAPSAENTPTSEELEIQQKGLQQALQLIERALSLAPQNPHYRETKGTVLYHLGEYEQAIAELEAAWPKLPPAEQPLSHRMLADSYQRLGNPSKSDEYQKLLAAPARQPSSDTRSPPGSKIPEA